MFLSRVIVALGGVFGGSQGSLGHVFGCSWGSLGVLLGALGCSWGSPGFFLLHVGRLGFYRLPFGCF